MNGDRWRRRSHLRSTEVTAMTQTDQGLRHLDAAGRQRKAIHALHVCRARLRDVQQAQGAPKGLTAADLRAALERRRQVLRGEPA